MYRKAYKAVILNFTGEIPKVHSLISLNGSVRNYLKIDINVEVITMLNEIYIDSRYPSEIGIDGINIPSIQTAQLFLQEAKKIFTSIREHLAKEN
jgi:HEPN domain-containing protein